MERVSGTSRSLWPNGHSATAAPGLKEDSARLPPGPPSPRSPGQGSADAPRRGPGPSTRPALVVFGIALLITIVGAVASGLVGQAPAPSGTVSVSTAKGSPLRAEAASKALAPVTSSGLPPTDVLDSIALPEGSSTTAGSVVNIGVGLYDRSLSFTVGASEQNVIEFFRLQLASDLWERLSEGPTSKTTGAYQIIVQHPSSDGYEWELGVTIDPERFFSTPQAQSTSSNGTTPFTLRLFEVSDDD